MLGRIRGKPKEDAEALEALRRRTAVRLAAIVGLSEDADFDDDLAATPDATPRATTAMAPDAILHLPAASQSANHGPVVDEGAEPHAGPDRHGAGDANAIAEPGPETAPASAGMPIAIDEDAPLSSADEAGETDTGLERSVNPQATTEEWAMPLAAAAVATTPVLLPANAVGVMAEPARDLVATAAAPTLRIAQARPVDPPPADAPKPARRAGATVPAAGDPPRLIALASPEAKPPKPEAKPPKPGAKPPKPGAKPPHPAGARRSRVSTLLPAACPTCGRLLDEVPTATRRCTECRQRIVVKRVDGRIVLLAEVAAPLFDAERRRLQDGARLKRECGRWLQLAALAGAAPDVLEARAVAVAARPTPEAVTSARALYATTVDRACRAARRARDWSTISGLRWRQARAYHRAAGAPLPADPFVIAVHRDGIGASLRYIAEFAREAELSGGRCCDACAAQDGRVVRIAAELKASSLPHADCPAGLCGCRWDVPAKRREAVTKLARRRAIPKAAGAKVKHAG